MCILVGFKKNMMSTKINNKIFLVNTMDKFAPSPEIAQLLYYSKK